MARPLALRVMEEQAHVYRRFWRGSTFAYVLNPIMFLAAMGIGLGGMVDSHTAHIGGVSYLVFVAPGLMAASAMQGAAGESLWPTMAGMKWIRTYHGMAATPIGPQDVYLGVVGWTAVRATLGAIAFVIVAALLGAVPSWWAPLAVPAAVLCGTAFAAPLVAFAATQETDARFPVIMRVGVIPLFLFSGTFFPIAELPGWLQPWCWLSPLWHGVELCRSATTGHVNPGTAVAHVLVLGACILAGTAWGRRTFIRRLTR